MNNPIGIPYPETVDDRIKQDVPSFNKKSRSKQVTPLTTQGFEGYVKKTKIDPKTNEEKISYSHAAGPITGNQRKLAASYLAPEPQYDDETVHNWVPHMGLAVVNEQTGMAMSAAEISVKRKNSWNPNFFVNPMQDLDYMVIEAMTRQTFIGPLSDALVKFIVGTGFKPQLELINPSGDIDKDEKLREENQDVIDALLQIDKQLEEDTNNDLDVSFIEKITALISGTVNYNRAALMFNYDTPIEIDKKSYKNIPSGMMFAHPRDLGIIEVSPKTNRLQSVQWRNAYYQVPTKDMIYLWNPIVSAKTRNSWFYGDSMILPMLDASRVIRKNIGVNFPAMAEATWAGMFLLGVRPQGQTLEQKKKEYAQISANMVTGGPNILLESPENYKVDSIDYNPKVTEFKDLTEFLLRYSVACLGLPQTMFYDESQSNRATMIGKILLARDTVINPMRNWIGRGISNQWYQRWFKEIYAKTKPELFKQFRIKIVFDDINIEEWFDKIEAVMQLDSRKPLTDEAFGSLAGIENYENKVDPKGEVTPGGKSKGLELGDGKSLQLKNKKEQLQGKKKALTFSFSDKSLAALIANVREDSFNHESSFIGTVTWYEDQTMTIEIKGKIYNYCGISRREFESFKGAPSKGAAFNRFIKGRECG